MRIRKMKPEDFQEVLAMMLAFYDSPAVFHKASEQILKKDILDCVGDCPYVEGYIFEEEARQEEACQEETHQEEVKQEKAMIAGYAMAAKGYSTEYGGMCIWIEDLYMKPDYRGCGIGPAFFEMLEQEYHGTAVRFRLEAEKENQHAIHVYEGQGFEESPYIVMDKVLG